MSVFPSRYRLVQLLGRGGGGEVWEAVDRATGGAVAIKVLHGGYHAAETEALIRETTALSGLEGLGFPQVLHLGRAADGRLFVVRELVVGESFEKVQEQEPRRALSLLGEAASVIAVVHRAGLLHGDIKPANLIVRPDGGVALVDLGLATSLREGGQTSLGLTPHFAAPEIKRGGPLTPQAEVYSLGIILRDLLKEGADIDLTSAAAEQVGEVEERATRADPEARYPSVDEFGSALRAALSGDVPMFSDAGPAWPVLGMEACVYQFSKAIRKLKDGETLLVEAPPGSGASTLFRRLAWETALADRFSLYVDQAVVDGGLLKEEIRGASQKGALLFVDADTPVVDADAPVVDADAPGFKEDLDVALSQGARVVRLASPGEKADFAIPELEFPIVLRLLRGALPGITETLAAHVYEKLGGRPGVLRRFAFSAEGLPMGTVPDVDRILSGALPLSGTALDVMEAHLDRGHFIEAGEQLKNLPMESARGLWLRARFELAAGTAAQAEEYTLRALTLHPDEQLKERLVACLARAHLGLGDYERALRELDRTEEFHPQAQAEALSYRGLALSLLGRNQEACEALERSLEVARAALAPRLEALAGSSLATARWRSGFLDEAEQSYRAAIAATLKAGDSGMLASTQINFSGLMKERGDLAASIELLEGAVQAASRAGRKSSVQQALLNLSNTDVYLGRLERARAQIARVGEPTQLPPALRAQRHGLCAEIFARVGQVEEALEEYDRCVESWQGLGRVADAAEAALESVLVAAGHSEEGTAFSAYVPSLDSLESRLSQGRELLGGKRNALLLLAEARVSHHRGKELEAERLAEEAREIASQAGHREWAWRAALLMSVLLDRAGKHTRAAKVREEAVEILEEIGARLSQDLREVYWSEPRRRALRASSERGSQLPQSPASKARPPLPEFVTSSGTDALSQLTSTPLERRLARVLAINSDLAGEADLDRLATKIVGHACELLKAERGYLLLGEGQELRVCAARSAQGGDHQEFSRSIAAEVLGSGKPLVSIDAGRDQRFMAFESVHLSAVSAVACVPVLSPAGRPIGALYVETRGSVSPRFADEVPTLQAFADQAAIALESSRLISALVEKTAALEEKNERLKEARVRLKELLGKRTLRLKEVKQELAMAKDRLSSHTAYGGMVGASDAMRKIYALIERVKDTDVPILITGESGTGKEIAARAIHEGSAREKGRMLAVNCGAIPESILESELFGHVRGAFTGADRERKGLFREADEGVLFLDEIGETPLRMQAGLLRVLQEGKVRPVGGAEEVSVDVRVIFATNRNLRNAVAAGEFREDLLYRIQVVEIALPPLRDRREDIPLLVDHFLSRFSLRFGAEKKVLSREALTLIMTHPFPGNIRQLENILLNAWVLSEGDVIDVEELALPEVRERQRQASVPLSPAPSEKSTHSKKEASEKKGTLSEHQRGERRRIVEALEATGWNRMKAAELVQLPRRTFYRRLREYKIQGH